MLKYSSYTSNIHEVMAEDAWARQAEIASNARNRSRRHFIRSGIRTAIICGASALAGNYAAETAGNGIAPALVCAAIGGAALVVATQEFHRGDDARRQALHLQASIERQVAAPTVAE